MSWSVYVSFLRDSFASGLKRRVQTNQGKIMIHGRFVQQYSLAHHILVFFFGCAWGRWTDRREGNKEKQKKKKMKNRTIWIHLSCISGRLSFLQAMDILREMLRAVSAEEDRGWTKWWHKLNQVDMQSITVTSSQIRSESGCCTRCTCDGADRSCSPRNLFMFLQVGAFSRGGRALDYAWWHLRTLFAYGKCLWIIIYISVCIWVFEESWQLSFRFWPPVIPSSWLILATPLNRFQLQVRSLDRAKKYRCLFQHLAGKNHTMSIYWRTHLVTLNSTSHNPIMPPTLPWPRWIQHGIPHVHSF